MKPKSKKPIVLQLFKPVPAHQQSGQPNTRNKSPENDLHKACVRWFRLQYPKYVKLLHHSPNGGKRPKQTKADWAALQELKQMSVIPGRPDLELNIAKGGYHGLFIELKVGKNDLSDNQEALHPILQEQGYMVVTVWTIDEFITIVKTYLNS